MDLLQSLYEPGKPVTSKVMAKRLGVSETRIGHILGEARRAGLVRSIPQQGWEPTQPEGT
ncbi:MAG: hypothetical protein WCB27_25825 [Thermoguttaceae bacterium]